MIFPSASWCALLMPASLPAAASGAGKASFLTPEFSGHEMMLGAKRKIRKNKGLDIVPADSRPPRVVEAAARLRRQETLPLEAFIGARHSSGAHRHDAPLEWRAPPIGVMAGQTLRELS